MLAIALAFLVVLCGALATYFFEGAASLSARLAMGVVIGFAALAHVAFLLCCVIGLNTATLTVLFLLSISALTLLWRRFGALFLADRRAFSASVAQKELWPTRFFLLLLFGFLWIVFGRVMFQVPDELRDGLINVRTGFVNNLGDLPLHLQIIGTFAHENNFPPQNPIFTGIPFSYPFLADFLSAIWLRLGVNIEYSMLLQNFVLMCATVILLRHLTWRMLHDRIATSLVPWIVLCSGGLGFWSLLSEVKTTEQGTRAGLWGILLDLPFPVTKNDGMLQWGNSISTLFVTQRSLVVGLPILLLVALLWWKVAGMRTHRVLDEQNEESAKENSRINWSLFVAGLLTGSLPLVHAHLFAATVILSFFWSISFRPRAWWRFWIPAIVLSLPQLWWLVGNSPPSGAFAWQPGWMSIKDTSLPLLEVWRIFISFQWINSSFFLSLLEKWRVFVSFWWVNSGLFMPLLVVAWVSAWMRRHDENRIINTRHWWFFLPTFLLGFVVPNLFKLAPWEWDNTKVFLVWWVFSAPFVALAIAWLWRGGTTVTVKNRTLGRRNLQYLTAGVCFLLLILSGALDVWRGVSSRGGNVKNTDTEVFTSEDVEVARALAALPAGGVFLHAPTYNSPVALAGKMSVMGYPGHIASYGINIGSREQDIKDFLSGTAGSEAVTEKYGVRYIVVGSKERSYLSAPETMREIAPPEFWKRWKEVARIREYSIYEKK